MKHLIYNVQCIIIIAKVLGFSRNLELIGYVCVYKDIYYIYIYIYLYFILRNWFIHL